MNNAFILTPQQGRLLKPYNVLGLSIQLKVCGHDTGGQISIFMVSYKRNQGLPLHLHDNDEAFYIIDGAFIFQVDDEKFTCFAGDIIFIPRNTPHAILNISETGRLQSTFIPAGNVEQMFEKFDSFKGVPSIEDIIKIHEEHGLKIVGPPLRCQ